MNMHIHKLLILCSGMALLVISEGTTAAGGRLDPVFDPTNFPDPITIDNPFFSLVPGTTFTYRSVGTDECQVNDVQVTGVTPSIAGIMTREVHDQVWEDDDCDGGRDFLSEDTLDWYAQDNDGNVWYLGEDTASYCDRDHPDVVCSTEGSWTAGVDDAAPGFVMLAHPTPGTSYPQEFLEGEAEDMAKVLRTNATVSLTYDNTIDPDNYTRCLKTKEWTPLDRGTVENKYYCRGVGLLLTEELKSGTVREELVNVSGP